MKQIVYLILILLTGFGAYAQDKIDGVTSKGEVVEQPFTDTYIVHGGCRPDNHNQENTEVWLYLSNVPYTKYDLNNTRATLYLPKRFNTVFSYSVCNFLANSMLRQTPVKMILVKHSYWKDHLAVKALDKNQVSKDLGPNTAFETLSNFSSRNHSLVGSDFIPPQSRIIVPTVVPQAGLSSLRCRVETHYTYSELWYDNIRGNGARGSEIIVKDLAECEAYARDMQSQQIQIAIGRNATVYTKYEFFGTNIGDPRTTYNLSPFKVR